MLAPPAATTARTIVDGPVFTPPAHDAGRSGNFVGRPGGFGLAALMCAVAGRVARWRRRANDRAELARMSRAELRDIRFNPSEAWNDANKPFWRS